MSESESHNTCCNCEAEIDILNSCSVCESDLCAKCSQKGDTITLCEWLEECSNQCSKCKRLGCVNCITTCYECQNWNEISKSDVICCECAETVLCRSQCTEHDDRDVCFAHAGPQCSQCESEASITAKQEDMHF